VQNNNNNTNTNNQNPTIDSTKNIVQNNNNNTNTNNQNPTIDSTKNIVQNNNNNINTNNQNPTIDSTKNVVQNINNNTNTNNQNSTIDSTKNAVQNNTITPVDTAAISLEDLLNFSHPDLIYRVQIGAYKYPKNFKYQHLLPLGQKAEHEKLPDGITRITLGRFATLSEAYIFRDKVRAEGVLDTFVTAIYKGKRYYLSELRLVLKNVRKPD
jgi:hypothetical protein